MQKPRIKIKMFQDIYWEPKGASPNATPQEIRSYLRDY